MRIADNPAILKTFALQTGSCGNAYFVETEEARLLFDAGINGVTAQRRMNEYGRDIRDVSALFVSHEHRDHIAFSGVYQRKFDMPIHMTRDTRHANGWPLGKLGAVHHFRSGESVVVGDATVTSVRTAHDAVDGVAFVIESGGKRLGILTDLGHAFEGLAELLTTLDGAYLEANYDPVLLEGGYYPYHVKARIRGLAGHLSNDDAAALVDQCGTDRLRWLTLVHLSADNNRPELAIGAARAVIGPNYPLHLAPRDRVSPMLEL